MGKLECVGLVAGGAVIVYAAATVCQTWSSTYSVYLLNALLCPDYLLCYHTDLKFSASKPL